MGNKDTRIILGGALWLVILVWFRPSLLLPVWAVVLLLLASTVIVPLAHQLISLGQFDTLIAKAALPAAGAMTIGFILPEGLVAWLLVLPWVAVTAVFALAGLKRAIKRGLSLNPALAVDAGCIYLLVGGVWTLLARMGAQPLGFSEDIVMLTAVHFHYAGFALPLLCGLAAAKRPGPLGTAAVLGVVLGVPLTAVGITLSQVGLGTGIETASAWLTAAAGLWTAVLYLRLAQDSRHRSIVRVLWIVTFAALTAGMILAAAYGSRGVIELEWLTIPWMRAVHGSVNSFGFALAGLLGWRLQQSSYVSATDRE